MNDPHVKSMFYRLKTDESLTFDDPPALEREFPSFRIKLSSGLLSMEMKDHYPDEATARQAVEPFLRSWELDVALKSGRSEILFDFSSAEVVERSPQLPGNTRILKAGAGMYTLKGFPAKLIVSRKQFPEPPTNLKFSVDVESLWNRYQAYIAGRETLLGMAYFCLTLIEWSATRKKAAQRYKIDIQVLSKLGELTSEWGDRSEARKLGPRAKQVALSSTQREWVLQAVRALIRRKAEYDFDPNSNMSPVTMSSLPATCWGQVLQ